LTVLPAAGVAAIGWKNVIVAPPLMTTAQSPVIAPAVQLRIQIVFTIVRLPLGHV
jgi:hypothetical protein